MPHQTLWIIPDDHLTSQYVYSHLFPILAHIHPPLATKDTSNPRQVYEIYPDSFISYSRWPKIPTELSFRADQPGRTYTSWYSSCCRWYPCFHMISAGHQDQLSCIWHQAHVRKRENLPRWIQPLQILCPVQTPRYRVKARCRLESHRWWWWSYHVEISKVTT